MRLPGTAASVAIREVEREYHAKLREKAGLPPIETVGAHRKFSGS